VFPSAPDVTTIQNSLGVALPSGAASRIGSMAVAAGTITATIANVDGTVNGDTLIMTPTTDAQGAVTWNWSGSVAPAYVPKR
jgi:hypothetical protein